MIFTIALILLIGIGFFYFKKGGFKQSLPYYARQVLLTKAELNFYRQIQPILMELNLFASFKVRLWDVIDVRKGTEKSFTYQNKISSKHIDFVLIDRDTNIIGCIELDDSSHNEKDRQEADQVKNEALSAAGVPLIRVKATRTYKKEAIRQQIMNIL